MYPSSVKQTYLAVFNSSASSAAVPGLATDTFSILLGARRSTQVTSQFTTKLDFVRSSRLKLLSYFTLLPYLAVNLSTFIDLSFSCLSTKVLSLILFVNNY